MTLGTTLLIVAAIAGVAGLLASLRRARAAVWLLRAHTAAVVAAMALLLLSFAAASLAYRYVWAHTTASYPLHYRLAGAWGGEEGTLLLWNAGVAVILLVLAWRPMDALRRRAATFLLAFSVALTAIALAVGTFAATSTAELAAAPAGRGLADVLLTPLMVVHPPVQFVAYALLAAPAAFALAHLAGKEATTAWVAPALAWARVAWFFATLGLGLGALWAYYVLSFGGYWAWDPVETSNLLPWLALTAFLHAAKPYQRHGDHDIGTPAVAVGGLALALFATFATRSGLWVSVHAFTDPTDRFEPDAAARLLAILDVHAPTRLVVALLLAVVLGWAALTALHHAGRSPRAASVYLRAHGVVALALAGAAALAPRDALALLFALASAALPVGAGLAVLAAWLLGAPLLLPFLAAEPRRRAALDERTLLTSALAILLVALGVAFVLNMQAVNGPDRSRFDVRAPFVVVPIVGALTLAMALPPLGRRGALLLAGAGLAGAAVGWALTPQARVVGLAAPPLAAAGIAVLLRLAHAQGRGQALARRISGLSLMALGLLLVALASNPPTHVLQRAVPSGPWVAAVGLAGGIAALIGGMAALRGRGLRRSDGARLRETGICVIHLAVVLGLLGYAASTYAQSREVFAAVPVGASVEVGGYELRLGAARAEADAAGRLVSAELPVALARGGSDAGVAALRFDWRGPPSSHYAPRLEVRRTLAEDVYLAPQAFRTTSGWVGAGSAGSLVQAEPIEAVTFTATVLPLVGLVWAGLWMGLAGMVLVLAGVAAGRGVAGRDIALRGSVRQD